MSQEPGLDYGTFREMLLRHGEAHVDLGAGNRGFYTYEKVVFDLIQADLIDQVYSSHISALLHAKVYKVKLTTLGKEQQKILRAQDAYREGIMEHGWL